MYYHTVPKHTFISYSNIRKLTWYQQ